MLTLDDGARTRCLWLDHVDRVSSIAINRRMLAVVGARRPSRCQRDLHLSVIATSAAAVCTTASDEVAQDDDQSASEVATGGEVYEERRRAATVEDDEEKTLCHIGAECDWSRLVAGQHDIQLVNVCGYTQPHEHH